VAKTVRKNGLAVALRFGLGGTLRPRGRPEK